MTRTQSPVLPSVWVERIFSRLMGIYGNQFAAKWDGCDLENVKQVWAEELGGFHDQPEAIAYALKHLDQKFPPSALEFKELCRKSPRKEVPMLTYTPTAEEIERAQAAAKQAQQAVRPAGNRDMMEWIKKPGSHIAFNVIKAEAKQNPVFAEIFAGLIQHGFTDGEKLLKRYDHVAAEWVPA